MMPNELTGHTDSLTTGLQQTGVGQGGGADISSVAAPPVAETPRMIRAARRDSTAARASAVREGFGAAGEGFFPTVAEADSAAVDSMRAVVRRILEPPVCHETDAPTQTVTFAERGDYMSGIEGIERPQLLGYDSGVMSLLIAAFLCIAFTFHCHTTFLKTFTQDLWSVRQRSNVFDDHTVSETRILSSLIMLVCVCEGLLLYSAYHPAGLPGGIFGSVGTMVCLAAVYYLVQLAAYTVTGYAFTDAAMTRQWIKGFNASQALLGLALTPPALWVAFRPASWEWVAPASILLYVVARIIFICKGFRIFYDSFSSLLYFILYLCTLEIVPLIAISRVCRFIQAS